MTSHRMGKKTSIFMVNTKHWIVNKLYSSLTYFYYSNRNSSSIEADLKLSVNLLSIVLKKIKFIIYWGKIYLEVRIYNYLFDTTD